MADTYKLKSRKAAKTYAARVLSKQERINELARQLNAGYKMFISK